MQFIPKKTKYKKCHRNRSRIKTCMLHGLFELNFGVVGLKALQSGEITSKQLEALRQSVNKVVKKKGKININIFAHQPLTAKPIETRMGKGKGNIDSWVYRIKKGEILCEIKTSSKPIALKALKSTQIKLPIQTKLIIE